MRPLGSCSPNASCSSTPSPTLSPQRARITCWMWMFHGSRLSSSSTLCSSDADRVLAVPVAVAPLGMRVAEAAHAEREQRLELDALLGAVVAQQPQRRALRAPQARRPPHVVRPCPRDARCAAVVGAPRRVAVADESSTAWLPTKRSPLPRSKQRKCVQQSSQLIGAQRKKICGSVVLGRGAASARRRAARPTTGPWCRTRGRSASSRRRPRCGPTTFPTASGASSPSPSWCRR